MRPKSVGYRSLSGARNPVVYWRRAGVPYLPAVLGRGGAFSPGDEDGRKRTSSGTPIQGNRPPRLSPKTVGFRDTINTRSGTTDISLLERRPFLIVQGKCQLSGRTVLAGLVGLVGLHRYSRPAARAENGPSAGRNPAARDPEDLPSPINGRCEARAIPAAREQALHDLSGLPRGGCVVGEEQFLEGGLEDCRQPESQWQRWVEASTFYRDDRLAGDAELIGEFLLRPLEAGTGLVNEVPHINLFVAGADTALRRTGRLRR